MRNRMNKQDYVFKLWNKPVLNLTHKCNRFNKTVTDHINNNGV